jgi:hypothetical protein
MNSCKFVEKTSKSKGLDEPICPYCKKKQIAKPFKTWIYYVAVTVERYQCSCGKKFSYYIGPTINWTIPKMK